MTRSRTHLQASSPVPSEGTRQASASPLIKEPAPESSWVASSKGKQAVIVEVDEEALGDERSALSSENTASSQYEVDEDSEGSEDHDDDFEEGEVNIGEEEEAITEGVETESLPATSDDALLGVKIPAKSPMAIEEEGDHLDYSEYGYSPGKGNLIFICIYIYRHI
jgi:hypothetical protein